MSDQPVESNRHEIKIDLQGLIRLLAKSLYAEADVFVREMVQNAHDSIKRRSELARDAAYEGSIRIRTDAQAGTITITDNGSGLTEQEIHDYLSTIGRSGTGEFRQELIKKGRQTEVTLIGQFGIGLLSAFVVAYRVEVETRSVQPDNPSWLWISEGQDDYQLGLGTREQPGTTVTLHISRDYQDMLDPEALRKAIKKYADFIPYSIYLNDQSAPANAVNAPWHRTFLNEREGLQEYWSFVSKRFSDVPLEVIPVALSVPYRVAGVLYISDERIPDLSMTGMVDIYQARMFITANNRDMLPSWAKFVRGVIDSPDLTPTAARDAIQQDVVAREIKEALGGVIVAHLQEMAKREANRLERILEWHSYHIKGMAIAHDDFFDAIADLVPFETNQGPMTLRRYCDRTPRVDQQSGQDIFYLSESGSATQFYMLCNAKGLLVINAGYVFDEGFLDKYAERRPDIRLHQISVAGSEFLFEPRKPEEATRFRQLEQDFQRVLPDSRSQARIVHFKPVTLPAVTVLTAEAKLREELKETQRNLILPESVRDLAGRLLRETVVPVILYLNADNPTIQKMADMASSHLGDREPYEAAARAIFNNAALLAHHLLTPDAVQAIFDSSNKIITLMIDQTQQFNEIQSRLSTLELTLRPDPAPTGGTGDTKMDHVICLVSLPNNDHDTFPYVSVLLPALQQVLEQAPYYWQVVRAEEQYFAPTKADNVAAWMNRAAVFIADISEFDPSVMMELGYMYWGGPQNKQPMPERRPLLVLERAGIRQNLPDLAGLIRFSYPAVADAHAVTDIANELREQFARKDDIQRLNARPRAHYLSPLVLQERFGYTRDRAERLADTYLTMEALAAAPPEDVLRRVSGLTPGFVRGLQDDLKQHLSELG